MAQIVLAACGGPAEGSGAVGGEASEHPRAITAATIVNVTFIGHLSVVEGRA
jgi:hypothetical protein